MKKFFLFIKGVFVFMVLAVIQFLFSGNSKHQKNTYKQLAESHWTGTLTLEEKYTGIMGTSERHVTVNFSNALPTLYRDDETADLDFTDDKGRGSVTYHAESFINGKKVGTTDCEGTGKSELHEVAIDEESMTYRIHAIGPACAGSTVSLIERSTTPYGPEFTDIIVSDQPLGVRQDIFSGAKTESIDMPGEMGTVTRTITWHLVKSTVSDVELIVTPEDYDNWLPEPGRNERTAGTIMKLSLKLRGRNGTTTSKKAKSFELRLSNTSTEPGMTINFPVNSLNTSPDLQFMPQANAVILDTTSQTMKIICHSGSQTGEFRIGSFDGGGWTVLNAEAILDDNTSVLGRLLVSNGETDIRIPKRELNAKIAEAWLNANANPGEMDDKEKSVGNTNHGDGLTAYEEYRGVISQAEFVNRNPNKFGRLDPNIKELGVNVDKAEFPLFSMGLKWFENGSGLKVIRFNETEIGGDRRLNKNALSAHIYDQYVLILYKGLLDYIGGALGCAFTTSNGPDIPANTQSVVIDVGTVHSEYNRVAAQEAPARLPFTAADMLANTVAHELGHAVNIWHHGQLPNVPTQTAETRSLPAYRIFRSNGSEILTRGYVLDGGIGKSGNQESGDLSCVMAYYPYVKWAYTVGADGTKIFNWVPLIPVGRKMCTSSAGTSFNHSIIYFGDATKGNCLKQIKLKP